MYNKVTMTDDAPMLVLDRVSRGYGARRVLRSLSFTARAGETVSIVGANGSGKSTLLKVVAGLLRPSGGVVTLQVNGKPLTEGSQRRAHVALAAPDVFFYPELSGRENLQFMATLRGQSRSVGPYLERVGLGARQEDPVGAYSSGMRQRVRLACALMWVEQGASLLLLDEPSLALDEQGVGLVADIIREQKARRGVTLLATNDRREAELGEHRLVLEQ